MVAGAQQDAVVEAGGAAVDPVAHVMPVQVTGVRASRELAAAGSAGEERAAQGAREDARLPPDAVAVDRPDARIAEEPPPRFRGDAGPGLVPGQGVGIEVDED